jgi:predicted transcriptional regulator
MDNGVGGEEIMMTSDRDKENKLRRRQNTLRLATCSNLRSEIMVSLKGGKKQLSELRDGLEVSSTTAIHALRELEKGNLVFQDADRAYTLTTIGEVVALKLVDFVSVLEVLKKHETFWLEHDLSDIPLHLLAKMGDLNNSILLTDTPTEIFKSHTTFTQVLEDANAVKGIYPIFNLGYLTIIEELVRRKRVDVELIVTNEVLGSIEGVIETEEAFKKSLREPNFSLFAMNVDDDIKIALTVTDTVFYIGLFAGNGNGLYDHNRALISEDEKALAWGRELHEYYRKKSNLVELGY